METIRLISSISAQNSWQIYQMYVKLTFLNGISDEEIYIEQPMMFIVKGHDDKVLRLKKALYGLKQVLIALKSRMDAYFKVNGFSQCPYKYALYLKLDKGDVLLACLYVDDIVFIANNSVLINACIHGDGI